MNNFVVAAGAFVLGLIAASGSDQRPAPRSVPVRPQVPAKPARKRRRKKKRSSAPRRVSVHNSYHVHIHAGGGNNHKRRKLSQRQRTINKIFGILRRSGALKSLPRADKTRLNQLSQKDAQDTLRFLSNHGCLPWRVNGYSGTIGYWR